MESQLNFSTYQNSVEWRALSAGLPYGPDESPGLHWLSPLYFTHRWRFCSLKDNCSGNNSPLLPCLKRISVIFRLRFIWIDGTSHMYSGYWAHLMLPGIHLEDRPEASLTQGGSLQLSSYKLQMMTQHWGLGEAGPGEEVVKMSHKANVHFSVETGLHFTKKEASEWKRHGIQSSEPCLTVCDRGQRGPWRWPWVTSVSSCFCWGSDQAAQPAPSAGNGYCPSGLY